MEEKSIKTNENNSSEDLNKKDINNNNELKKEDKKEQSDNSKLDDKEKEHDKNKNSEMAASSFVSTEAKTTESSISSENNNDKENSIMTQSKENNNKINTSTNKDSEDKNKNNESITQKQNFNSLTKLDKNGNLVDISGYYIFQFLGGFLLDCLVLINNELSSIEVDSNLKDLFLLTLDTFIYVSSYVRANLKKLKSAINNRKLTIVSQVHSILASYELIINNISDFYQYDFSPFNDIDEKLRIFANMSYTILMESQEISAIPLKLLVGLINFICSDNVRIIISNFNENQLYKVFLSHIENLNENELKNIRNNELMKGYCKFIVNRIFKQQKIISPNICYYSYLINCLKCNSLEKKNECFK